MGGVELGWVGLRLEGELALQVGGQRVEPGIAGALGLAH